MIQSGLSALNLMLPLSAENKNSFINNFLAYIENSEDSGEFLERLQQTQLLNSIDYGESQNTLLPNEFSFYSSYQPMAPQELKKETQFTATDTYAAFSTANLNEPTSSLTCSRGMSKRLMVVNENLAEGVFDKEAPGLASLLLTSACHSTHMMPNPTKERKKSLPNIVFHNHRQSDMPPFINKKKYSTGQIKVR